MLLTVSSIADSVRRSQFRCRWSMALEQFIDLLASYWHWTWWIQTTDEDVLV